MNKIISTCRNLIIALLIPLVLYIFLYLFAPVSMGTAALWTVFQQAMLPAVLAWGVMFCFKLGLWHFAIGAIVVSCTIIGGGAAKLLHLNYMGIAAVIIITGIVLGLLSGLLYVLLKVPSIIATVGTMLILESIGALAWGGGGVVVDKSYSFFNKPAVVVIITVICFLAAYFLYCHTKYGYNLRAVGSNITVAETQGINVIRIKIASFVVAGLFSSLYAVLSLGKSCVQNPITNMGSMDMVFNAIMCCFVAMALEQRICLVTGVFIGSFTVQLIKLGIVALGVSGQFNNSAIAITLLVFCAVNSNSEYINAIRGIFHRHEKTLYGKSL